MRELGEEQLLGAFGADTEVPHERPSFTSVFASSSHEPLMRRAPLECASVDRLEAAMRDRLLVKRHGGTRNELEVRREPLLDCIPQCVVGGERLVGKLRTGLWARVVRGEPELDAVALVAVTIGTGDWVVHYVLVDRAQEGRGRQTVHAALRLSKLDQIAQT